MEVEFLIVGQGIAGTCLSYFLRKAGKTVKVIDQYDPQAASNIASGIINPITGRNFVKTWMADELIPFADQFYVKLEAFLVDKFYSHEKIYKLFSSIKDQNEWSSKAGNDYFGQYLKSKEIITLDDRSFINPFGVFEIDGRRVNGRKLMKLYRSELKQQGLLLESKFNHQELQILNTRVKYKDITAKNIIFSDGFSAVNNPLFSWLPFVLAKGEVLIVKIEDVTFNFILNGKMILMPLTEEHLFYVGSTRDWHDQSLKVTTEMYEKLIAGISNLTPHSFEVVEQRAAIRPTVRDRRPIIGSHPEYKNVFIFNGMGTKGFSLAPYFANEFVSYLVESKPLNKEVDISRNYPFYEAV